MPSRAATFAVGLPRSTPLPTGHAALVEWKSTPLTANEHEWLASSRRMLTACEYAYVVAFVVSLAAPVLLVGKTNIDSPLVVLLEAVAMVWGVSALDGAGRYDFGVSRWPGLTAALCLAGAFGVWVSHGRADVALGLVAWALPGMVQLVRYRAARVGLDALAYTRRMVADLPVTGWPPPPVE